VLEKRGHPVLFFSALGERKGMPYKSSAATIPRSLLLGTGLTWSNLTRGNSGKVGRLNEQTNVRFLKLELSRESQVIPGTRNISILATANLGLSSK